MPFDAFSFLFLIYCERIFTFEEESFLEWLGDDVLLSLACFTDMASLFRRTFYPMFVVCVGGTLSGEVTSAKSSFGKSAPCSSIIEVLSLLEFTGLRALSRDASC